MKDKRIFFWVVASLLVLLGMVTLSTMGYMLLTVPGPVPAPTATATGTKAPPHVIRGTVITGIPAEPAPALEIEIVDYGLYAAGDVKVLEGANSPTDHLRTFETDLALAKQTDVVPAVLNTKFGFRFKVLGLPEGTTARLRLEFAFPEMTKPDTGKVSSTYGVLVDAPAAPKIKGMFWDFVHPYEMRPGQWTMSIYDRDHLLAQKKFTVTESEANRSQPVSSETNQTSAAADSGGRPLR